METSCDRSGSLEPMVLPKRQLNLTAELEKKFIHFSGLGLSTRDIIKYVKEIYQMNIAAARLYTVTDLVFLAMNEWRNCPLESV